MIRTDPLPREVAPVLAAYRRLLEAEGAPAPTGLYLVGSVALGDFRPGTSDIDVVALLDGTPSEVDLDSLARIHARLAEAGGPHLDVIYLPAAMLRQPAPGEACLPFSVDGQFRSGQVCREVNPAVWRCLARHGRTVLGPPPAELGIADDDAVLRAHQTANLDGYWRAWIAQAEAGLAAKAPGEDCNAAALAWGVLGVGRSACTLATGDIVTKAEGGRFGLRAYPASRHPIIREALAIHDGGPARTSVAKLDAALDYVRFVIAAAAGYEAGMSRPLPST